MIDPVNSRVTSGASAGSSGLTSSVMMGGPDERSRVDEAVADFAAGAGDQNDRFAHVCATDSVTLPLRFWQNARHENNPPSPAPAAGELMSPPSPPPGGVDTDRLFRALVENSSDAIVLLDAEGVITFASQSSARLLGYALDERLGRQRVRAAAP